MTSFEQFLPSDVLAHLGHVECDYLSDIFFRFNGYPNLQELWKLIDEPWIELGCDPANIDSRFTEYYNHPVWLLNGLFVEQDHQSITHRRAFADWVANQSPARVADFGGGFGGLARFIGAALPQVLVEVVEPHPHPAAIALAADTPNVRFVPELTEDYDVLIATDVFEHVPDPISLAACTASHLRIGGQYLIANCFAPVIACHLPQLFYLSIGWDQAMRSMGLYPHEKVQYGRSYRRTGYLDLTAARQAEALAQRVYPWVQFLPKGRSRVGHALMRLTSAF